MGSFRVPIRLLQIPVVEMTRKFQWFLARLVLGKQRRNVYVTVLDLPDATIERLFGFLADELFPGDRSRTFPCNRHLFSLGFSFSRFSKLFRKSYIRELLFCIGLRFVRGAAIYHDAVSGALKRFSPVKQITVVGSDCVSTKALVKRDTTFHPLGDSLLPFRLAVAARRSIAAAVTGGLSNGANFITKIKFERGTWGSHPGVYGVHDMYSVYSYIVSFVSKELMDLESIWKWRAEQERWLDYFPHVTTTVFGELGTFCTAPRLCGPYKVGLKNVSITCEDRTYIASHPDTILLELVQFRNIETLALVLEESEDTEADLKTLDIPTMVEMLPKKQNVGIRLEFWTIEDIEDPVLKFIFRDPASPVDRRLKLTICVDDLKDIVKNEYEERKSADLVLVDRRPGSDREVDALCFEEFEKALVGQFHSHWTATEIFGDSIVGKLALDSTISADLRFHPLALSSWRACKV